MPTLFYGTAQRCSGGKIDARAKLFEDIRRTAARANRAVAVLRHANACARDHECRDRGNVECPGAIAAGAAGIDKGFVHGWLAWQENRFGVAPHRFCETHNFIQRLGFHPRRPLSRAKICASVARPERTSSMACFSLGARQILFSR